MIKEILKRGIAGAIISLVAIISMLLGVLVVTGTSQITIQISEIIKYTFIIMVAGFIISSSTIIFSIKNMSLVIKGFIHLINSGASCLDGSGKAKDKDGANVIKPWFEINEEDQEALLSATTWNPADTGYFRGGGYSSRFLTDAQMPVTMTRLNLVKGVGPVLQLVEGYTVKLPDEVSDKLWKRTDYTWPCTWFAPRLTGKGAFKSAYDVMNNWGANHGAISYGHIGADIITLCSILRIPVSMHNVPEENIFRPAAWNAFGMDKEGQDYRACQNYGPMYK